MPVTRIDSHDDLLSMSGFRVEASGNVFSAFTNVGGFNRNTETLQWFDGGSGNVENFSGHLKNYGPLSMSYRVDPTKLEFRVLRAMVTASMLRNIRHDLTVIKYHRGVELFRIVCYGCLFNNETLADLDNNADGPYEVTLEVPCSYFEVIEAG